MINRGTVPTALAELQGLVDAGGGSVTDRAPSAGQT